MSPRAPLKGSPRKPDVSRALIEIEKIGGPQLAAFVPMVLERHRMMCAGFKAARSGYEGAPVNDARENRYTPEGIRRDLRRIRTAALRSRTVELERELRDTSHTTRNLLSRALFCEQDVRSILARSLPEIAKQCAVAIDSPLLAPARRGPRVDEAADALVISVAELHRHFLGKPSASARGGRPSKFVQLLDHVFRLAGQRRSVQTLISRCKELGIGSATATRQSRFGPAVRFGHLRKPEK